MMATIRDIAREAGVSVGTASRAITGNGYVSDETRLLVLETAKKLRYTPKEKNKNTKSTHCVGVVLPDISFPFYGAFLKYVEVELARHGYKTVVCNALGVQGRVSEMLELLEKQELDGLILNADVTIEEIARMERLPVVSFERLLGSRLPMVSSDHRQGGQLAAQELFSCGCRNVLLLTVKHGNRLFGDFRTQECQRILQEHGVRVTVAELSGAVMSYKIIKEQISEYLKLYSRTDGVFTDDVMAYCCLAEAAAQGIRIPEQMKIVGYDGNELTQITSPQITTVVQNVPQLTRHCVDLVLRRMAGERTAEEIIVPVEFKKGGTT